MPNLTIGVLGIKPKKQSTVLIGNHGNANYVRTNFRKNFSWGLGLNGVLGLNSTTTQSHPIPISGANKTFCKLGRAGGVQIQGSQVHALAIDLRGKVWGWGSNISGQLGNNSTSAVSTPVSICGANKTFCEVTQGFNHSLGIDKNGRVWAWGLATGGALGNNSTTPQRNTPVSILGANKTFCKIAAGNNNSAAIDFRGQVWTWGSNTAGALGDNSITSRLTPVAISGALKTFCDITFGNNYMLAIDFRGTLWAWGINNSNNLGDGTTTSRLTPIKVSGACKTFCRITAGNATSMALDLRGRGWSWGAGPSGVSAQDGAGTLVTPTSIKGAAKTFCQIEIGAQNGFALDYRGKIWTWGSNIYGELGRQYINLSPLSILKTSRVYCLAGMTTGAAFVINNSGTIFSWGDGTNGRLGQNITTCTCSPQQISGAIKTFCLISGGLGTIHAIDKNGRAWGWGINTNNQIGDNTAVNRCTPVSVAGAIKTFCKISDGNSHSLVIDKNGRVWGWGTGTNGRIGDNNTANRATPVSILGANKTFCQIAAGNDSSAGIDLTGRVWCWGNNTAGQLGDNTLVSKNTPVSILGALKTFCQIAIGNQFVIALDLRGTAWAWGAGSSGFLGDNQSTLSRSTPIRVSGACKTFCKIACNTHTIALDNRGTAWGWGNNVNGGIGDMGSSNRLTPVRVCGATKTFCDIAVIAGNSLAIDNLGNYWVWGLNGTGQLGTGIIPNTPVRMCML